MISTKANAVSAPTPGCVLSRCASGHLLPQIAILPARYPDPGKAIFQQQLQNQLRILPVRLLLPHPLAADRGRISDPQLNLQLGQQAFPPACVPARFHPHTHRNSAARKLPVKPLRLLPMLQSLFLELPTVGIHRGYLLKLGVEIYSYNDHCSAPFSRACWLPSAPPIYSSVGADIVMESITPAIPVQCRRMSV